MVATSLNINCHKITTREVQTAKYEALGKQEVNNIYVLFHTAKNARVASSQSINDMMERVWL